MYAYCATDLINPLCVCLPPLNVVFNPAEMRLSVYGFCVSRVFPLCCGCLSKLKTTRMNLVASAAIGTGQCCEGKPYCVSFRSI